MASSAAQRIGAHASMEEIDRALIEDELALKNVKRDIVVTQREELGKMKKALLSTKKDYDTEVIDNKRLVKQAETLKIKLKTLQEIDQSVQSDTSSLDKSLQKQDDHAAQVKDDLAAEQRTVKMLQLIVSRLNEELEENKRDLGKASETIEQARNEQNSVANTLLLNKADLSVQEVLLDKLKVSKRNKQHERLSKAAMLDNMERDGEKAVRKVQAALEKNTKKALQLLEPKQSVQVTDLEANRIKLLTMGGDNSGDDSDADEPQKLKTIAKRMDINDLREVYGRWNTHTQRMDRLHQLYESLRIKIKMQYDKKKELSEQLQQTILKINQLASARQTYQEVETKDSALSTCMKEVEEWKNKTTRVKVNIESLRQCIPRLLTKVTGVVQRSPSAKEITDSLLKLQDEVLKLIKIMGVALLKEELNASQYGTSSKASSPRNTSSGTPLGSTTGGNGVAGGGDERSEFARLQQLPGYSQLKQQLFYNLMTAVPDSSAQNIRIDHAAISRKVKNHDNTGVQPTGYNRSTAPFGEAVMDFQRHKQKYVGSSHGQEEDDYEEGGSHGNGHKVKEAVEDESLDRACIKKISKLIQSQHTEEEPGGQKDAVFRNGRKIQKNTLGRILGQ